MKKIILATIAIVSFCILSLGVLQTSSVLAAQDPPNPSSTGNCPTGFLDTAIGCIPMNDTQFFVVWLFRWGVGVGGGIAFLLILYGGFLVMTSQGDPKRAAGGQETITSAVMGLIMMIFAVFILRVIGVDILKIPGF